MTHLKWFAQRYKEVRWHLKISKSRSTQKLSERLNAVVNSEKTQNDRDGHINATVYCIPVSKPS